MSRILIVEDEESIAELEKDYLELSGFEVEIENNGETGLKRGMEEDFDLLILDLMLPGVDGFEICKKIREVKNTPIIMVSAKKDDIDKIRGLGLGADDYITKPFNPVEVIARVRSQLRRYMQLGGGSPKKEDGYTVGGIELNDKTKQVLAEGNEVSLTPTEFEILKLLMKNAGAVLSPKEIYENVWGGDAFGAESTVAVHIRHLREKIEINPSEPKYLKVVWAHGYKLEKGDK